MAVITDPDVLSRYEVIFGSDNKKVSIYPIDDTTKRGSTIIDAYVSSAGAGTITSANSAFDAAVAVGDVVAVVTGPDAGHYFVQTDGGTASVNVSLIDDGAPGVETTNVPTAFTGLTANAKSSSAVSAANDTLTITTHGYKTGDAIVYTANGGTDLGITSADGSSTLGVGSVFFVVYEDADTIKLAETYADAVAATPVVLDITGTPSASQTFNDRLILAVYANGANSVDAAVTPIGERVFDKENDRFNLTTGNAAGNVKDGITLQTIYSFGKDEWRADGFASGGSESSTINFSSPVFGDGTNTINYTDDLIRVEYPFESITSEQFEIGGGTAHDDWTWFNDYTRQKVRTAGWADKAANSNDIDQYAGIITLGSLDIDSQVYYQQTSETTNPEDFVFQGVVNEALLIKEDTTVPPDGSSESDFTTYLKLFVRKKGRSYAQSEIADIGVTTIQTIVNRFPLTHSRDAAITITDAQLLGTNPYKFAATPDGAAAQIATGTDGTKSDNGTGDPQFASAGVNFETSNVVAGDILRITGPEGDADIGYYEITGVSTSTLTLRTVETIDASSDFQFSDNWANAASNAGSVEFDVYTSIIVADKTAGAGAVSDFTTGTIEDGDQGVDTTVGILNDSNSRFGSVAKDDLVLISETAGTTAQDELYEGVYKVIDNTTTGALAPSATKLYLNTTDAVPGSAEQGFPATPLSVNYRIVEPGMYIQFKDVLVETVTASSVNVTASASGKTLTRASGSWDTTIGAGTMIIITGSASNDGRYTVLSSTSNTLTLIATDTLVDETISTGTVVAREGFRRTVGSTTYAFRYKITGNNGGLDDVFRFVQQELRSTGDIDVGDSIKRGDITDLLMTFASPTGVTIDMFIDNLDAADINNITLGDHSGVSRNFPFTSSGSLVFNNNLVNDANSKYWLFFANDNAGDNQGRDFGTKDAIIVNDADLRSIAGTVNGSTNHTTIAVVADAAGNISIPFTFDYDGNTQRGAASAGEDAPVVLVAIGLSTAQYVQTTATITRNTGITISAVSTLERNYLTGSV